MLLYLHVLPYLLLLGVIVRFLLFSILGLEPPKSQSLDDPLFLFYAREIAWGIAWGVVSGVALQVFVGYLLPSNDLTEEDATSGSWPRVELFSADQMERHAKTLADSHRLSSKRTPDQILARLAENESVLREALRTLTLAGDREPDEAERQLGRVPEPARRDSNRISIAGERLVAHLHLIEEHLRTARRHFLKGYSRELMRLAYSKSVGMARVYDIVLEVVLHGDEWVNREVLSRFVAAYQKVTPLSLSDLWAIPVMLRVALIESLRRAAVRVVSAQLDRDRADGWGDEMIATIETDPKSLILVVADMARANPPRSSAFVAGLASRLKGQGPSLSLPLTWVASRLSESGRTIEQMVEIENQQQAAAHISISSSISSFSCLGAMDWRGFVETLHLGNHTLGEDTSVGYGDVIVPTHDRYKHADKRTATNKRLSGEEAAREGKEPKWIGSIAAGFAVGIAMGSAAGIVIGVALGISGGIGGGIAGGIAIGISIGIISGIAYGTTFGMTRAVAGGIIVGIILWLASGTIFGIISGTTVGLAGGITFVLAVLRAHYHSIHWFFVWPRPNGRWYPRHPVAWDDLCSLPFPGLDRLLIAYVKYDPPAGWQEIERLIDHYPSQRMAALRTKATLLVREAGQETNLGRLDAIVARLPEGNRGFLRSIPRLRKLVGEFAQVQRRLDAQDRPFLREPTAALLCEKIKNFQSQISGFPQPLSIELRATAQRWLEVAELQHRQTQTVLAREPMPQVFRAGDPVERIKEAFVLRDSVLGELDRQLTLSSGCPGLILYGRRRMGKSTLLRNLDGFLPTSVRTVTLSMQDPDVFTSQASFLNRVARELRTLWPDLPPRASEELTLKTFYQLLTECNAYMNDADQRLLLAIDEYENLDRKLGEGVFNEDLLATLRESIQTHRRITWIFAGSHTIDELPHAPWSSYLVSSRTLEIPPLSDSETRLLLTEPLRYSSLWDKDDPKRPRFDPQFWGPGGIERIHHEAGGWPHLVQLLAETAVDLCNDREQAQVDTTLLEEAIHKSIVLGHNVLRELMNPKDASPAEWAYLRAFRTRDTQLPPDDETVYQALRRRLLVEEVNGELRLWVPLMQRWLRGRGLG